MPRVLRRSEVVLARVGATSVRRRRKTLGPRSLAVWFRKEPRELGKVCRLFARSRIDGEEDGGGGVVLGVKLVMGSRSSR